MKRIKLFILIMVILTPLLILTVFMMSDGVTGEPDFLFSVKLSPTGREIWRIGTFGSGDGQFNFSNSIIPVGIAVDSAGSIYVAESGNNRIQKFDSNGKFLVKFGTPGSGDGQFLSPEKIAVDSSYLRRRYRQ